MACGPFTIITSPHPIQLFQSNPSSGGETTTKKWLCVKKHRHFSCGLSTQKGTPVGAWHTHALTTSKHTWKHCSGTTKYLNAFDQGFSPPLLLYREGPFVVSMPLSWHFLTCSFAKHSPKLFASKKQSGNQLSLIRTRAQVQRKIVIHDFHLFTLNLGGHNYRHYAAPSAQHFPGLNNPCHRNSRQPYLTKHFCKICFWGARSQKRHS